MDETLNATFNFVDGIVEKAISVQPGTDVCAMTLRLLYALGVNTEQAEAATVLGMAEEQQRPLPVQPPHVVKTDICAPYPSSAIGGDVYDPMDATRCLPSFLKLPFEFCDAHSVIRVGEQTVVMNSSHYSDLLKLREYAATAIRGEQVMRQVAESSATVVSNIQGILQLEDLSIKRKDDGFAVNADSCGVVTTGRDLQSLREALSTLICEVRATESVLSSTAVSETPREPSGAEDIF